jgi:hypothetical protein
MNNSGPDNYRNGRRAGLKHLWETDNYRHMPVRSDSYRNRRWVQSLIRKYRALLFHVGFESLLPHHYNYISKFMRQFQAYTLCRV